MTRQDEGPTALPDGRWNLFARELEDILTAHGLRWKDLYHAGIYREEVRRLRHSLKDPGTFPLLSPADLELVYQHCRLTPDEIWRLRTAVVATAVERLLYGRIAPEDARQAALELYPLLLRAVRAGYVSKTWRHDDATDATDATDASGAEWAAAGAAEAEDAPPRELEAEGVDVVEALDDGAMALHLSSASHLQRERVRWARAARRAYARAEEMVAATMAGAPPAAGTAAMAILDGWTSSARRGRQEAARRLLELGAAVEGEEETRDVGGAGRPAPPSGDGTP